MARIRQQVSWTSALANEQTQEQTHKGRHSIIDKVEQHVRWLSYVEQNVDTMQAVVEWVEALMVQMAHNLYPQAPQ